jgi:hypothetical protein
MAEPARKAGDIGDLPGMDSASVAARRRRLEKQIRAKGIKPLTRARLSEIATGGPWESDEEFEEYLAFVNAHRGRPSP